MGVTHFRSFERSKALEHIQKKYYLRYDYIDQVFACSMSENTLSKAVGCILLTLSHSPAEETVMKGKLKSIVCGNTEENSVITKTNNDTRRLC